MGREAQNVIFQHDPIRINFNYALIKNEDALFIV